MRARTHDYQIRRYGDIGEKLTTGKYRRMSLILFWCCWCLNLGKL